MTIPSRGQTSDAKSGQMDCGNAPTRGGNRTENSLKRYEANHSKNALSQRGVPRTSVFSKVTVSASIGQVYSPDPPDGLQH